MKKFDDIKRANLEKLELYVPVVARVHGNSHPQFHEVRKVYDEMIEKLNKAGAKKPELDAEFNQLREITDNYTVPNDVCETYEAVYHMLEELDKEYQDH